MDKLAVVGVHAMLCPDDASAAFVNSSGALVPWSSDGKVLMDRFDARHLLENLSSLSNHRGSQGYVPDVSEDELNRERYRDLHEDDCQETVAEKPQTSGGYNSVPFRYPDNGNQKPASPEQGGAPFVPDFPVPDHLKSYMPSTLKLHQIICGTAKFVSRQGGQSEIVLRVKQADNPTFGFLMPDHHLHPYFRYLVDNPALTGALDKLPSVSILKPTEGLALLSQYGDDEEDRDAESVAACSKTAARKGRDPPAMAPYKEPPEQLKNVIHKMVEFIHRNGKEFEDVVKTRDQAEGKFDFLHPWHEYYPYYLKILQIAKQAPSPAVTASSTPASSSTAHLSGGSKSRPFQSARGRSRFDITPSMLQPANDEDCEPIEIVAVKDVGSDSDFEQQQGGMSFDEAFAAVMAATRGRAWSAGEVIKQGVSAAPSEGAEKCSKPKVSSEEGRKDSHRESSSRQDTDHHRRRRRRYHHDDDEASHDDKRVHRSSRGEEDIGHKRRRSDEQRSRKDSEISDDLRAKVREMLARI